MPRAPSAGTVCATECSWDEVHFNDGTLLVRRVKNGRESRHFLEGDEIRQLKQLRRESPPSRFVFCSERGGPLSNRTVDHIVKRAGEEAELPFSIHPAHAPALKDFSPRVERYRHPRNSGLPRRLRDIKSTVIYNGARSWGNGRQSGPGWSGSEQASEHLRRQDATVATRRSS